MGWQDDPIVGTDSGSTNISTTQLASQGMRYTPEQMAAFDSGRGRILAMETQAGQANPDLGIPPQAEIKNLNPTALESFNQNMAQPDKSSPAAWEKDPVVQDIGTKLKNFGEKYIYGKNPLAEAVGSAAAGLDTVAPIGTAIGGANALLGRLLPKGLGHMSSEEATQHIETMSAYNLGKLLEKTYPEAYDAYLRASNPIHKFGELTGEAGGKVTDITHSPVAGTATNLLLQVIPFILGDKALGATIKTPLKGAALQEAKGYITPEVTGADAAQSALNKMGVNTPDSIGPKTGKATNFDDLKGEEPVGVDATPDEMTTEFNNRQGAFNFDPLQRGESGDMFGPNVRGTQDVTSGITPDEMTARRPVEPSQGELDLTNNTPPDAQVAKKVISDIEGEGGLKPTVGPGFPDVPAESFPKTPDQTGILTPEQEAYTKTTQENSAWEKYKARVAEQQRRQAEADAARNAKYGPQTEMEPAQSSPTVEKMAAPINSRTGQKIFVPRGQRGAVNLGGAEEIAKRIENLKKGLMNIGRDPSTFAVGDTVRLMNGKVGTILKVTDGRYQIKGKDFMDSVPIQGIDYKYKPSGLVNSSVGYPKGQPHPLGGVGKKQGGAIDLKAILGEKNLRKETDGSPEDLLMRTDPKFKEEMVNQNHWKFEEGDVTRVPSNHSLYGGMPYRITQHEWLSLSGRYAYRGDVLNPDGSVKREGLPIRQETLEKRNLGGVGKKGFGQGGAIDPDTFVNMFPRFKGSKVVDAITGKLKAVFHGTSKDVDFKNFKVGQRGAWFTTSPEEASMYAKYNDSRKIILDPIPGNPWNMREINSSARVHQVYLDIKNPYTLQPKDIHRLNKTGNYSKLQRELFQELRMQGYDGVLIKGRPSDEFGPNDTWIAFKPEQIVSATAPRDPFKGPGRKQAGAINVRSIFDTKDPSLKPEEPKGIDLPLSDKDIIGVVYKNWNRSSDLNDFKEGLRLEKKFNPNFPQEVIDSAETLWNNFEKGYRPEGKSTFGSMSNLNQRDASDTRPLEQMMEETVTGKKTVTDKVTGEKTTVDRTLANSKLSEADDLSWPTKELFAPLHIVETNWAKPAGKIFNNVYSNVADVHKFWKVKLKEYMDNNLPYKRLPRKEQLTVSDAERFWDTTVNRQQLIDQGLMWPTKEMLMDKRYNGLTSRQADAYLARAKGYDAMWKDSDITEKRLPGYMPHTWEGAWRVNILDTSGVLGPDNKGLVEVLRKNTRYAANAAAKAAREKGFEVEIIEPKLGNKNGFITNLEKQIQMAGQFGKLGKAFQKMLVDIHNKALEGTITESLERRGVGGYLGEHGSKPERLLMNPYTKIKNMTYNNRLIDLYEHAANDFARAGRNRQLIEGIARPFYRNIDRFKDAPNLIDAVDDLLSTATGFRRQEALKLDRFIKQLFVKSGLAPDTPTNILNFFNGYARLQRINSANIGFAAEHGAFSLPGIWDLLINHYERGVRGEKQGSYMKAIGAFGRDWITFGKFRSAEGARAEKWAVDNGVYHSNYYDEHQYQGQGEKLVNLATHGALNYVINRMKSVTFQMAYRYYRDIMPEQQALSAAKNHTMKTMQSFDEIDRPEIFKEGLGGHSVRTFNQIHLYNMARVFRYAQSYLQNVTEHPLASQKLLLPLIGLTTTWLALGGAKGLPFHDDWNLLREWIMDNHPNAILPGYEELMERAGLPNWMTFGLVPTLTGADIRGTFTFNISNSLSGAGLETLGALGSLGLEKLVGFITGKENPDVVYKNVRKLIPTTAVPWLEDEMAKKLGGNIPKPSKLEGTTPRTQAEDIFYKMFSKKAISESMRNEHIDLMKEIDARNTRAREYYVDLMAKKIAGFNTGRDSVIDLVNEAVDKDIGFDPRDLKEALEKKLRSMNVSADVSYIEKAANSAEMIKANKFNNINKLLHGGQLGK